MSRSTKTRRAHGAAPLTGGRRRQRGTLALSPCLGLPVHRRAWLPPCLASAPRETGLPAPRRRQRCADGPGRAGLLRQGAVEAPRSIVRPAARVGPGTIDIQAPLEAHGSNTTGLTAAVRHVREALLSMAKTVHSETAREVGRLWALSVLGRIWRATSNGGSETERLASIGSGRCCTSRRLGGSSTLSTNTLCQATRSPTRLLLKAASTILRL